MRLHFWCWPLDGTTTYHAGAIGAALASGSTSVDFKMATLVYLSLSGMAPAYLAADCQLVSDEGRRQLRFATSRKCVDSICRWRQVFAAAGLTLWNSLSADLREASINFQRFKRLLKKFCSDTEIAVHFC